MNCNFILVLVFAGILCCAAQSDDTISGLYPQNDHFKLSLVWPNSYCVADISKCRSPLPQLFTIKAFWAELHDGRKLINCRTYSPPLTEAMISRHTDDLQEYWPDLSTLNYQDMVMMWKNTWAVYGTCASNVLSSEDYVRNTIAVRQSHNLYNMLKESGIVPNGRTYSADRILNALQRKTGTYVDIVCSMDRKGTIYLSEIHQCLDSTAKKFIDCENKAIHCYGDPVFPDKDYSEPMKVRNATTTLEKQVTETHA
ncbi:hypothetical protein L6164_005663 [Bauhinia variegata]|uniref:Uncharacterized protein n=1 Tax=Bauhinia variegata TaxID=167791 RepID=A0ACB9PU37_BAUVA|nr:hypothetical protein L6164_005663 [Bauhinia variegata]